MENDYNKIINYKPLTKDKVEWMLEECERRIKKYTEKDEEYLQLKTLIAHIQCILTNVFKGDE